MKKIAFLGVVLLGGVLCAQAQEQEAPAGAECNLPKEAAQVKPEAAAVPVLSQKEQYKRFKARNKQIRKLKKAYHKASAEQKPVIKQQLFELVSQATDESRAWAGARIASERAALDRWEQHMQEQGKDLLSLKAQRVDDILSGEAERRHKLAQKRWKAEMKDRKKYMK